LFLFTHSVCSRSHSLEYRLYKPEDFEPLYAVEEACFEPPFRFSRGAMRKLVRSQHAATWIAEEDSRMSGFAIVEWAEEAGLKVAYIPTIEVAPARRRAGTGHELLRRVEQSAQLAGARVIWLHVDEENSAAIRLYESHGYRREGRQADFYPRGRAALVYAKPIGAVPLD
jgi:ribosomal-protein-alanine N-acetyltransferase